MKNVLDVLTLAGALGSGLVAGIFFPFSSFVMRALSQLPERGGIAAMKALNVTVLKPAFFLAFFGTGAVCLPLTVLALRSTAGTSRVYLLAACGLYLFGCLLVTMAFNVPLNNQLASATAGCFAMALYCGRIGGRVQPRKRDPTRIEKRTGYAAYKRCRR